MSRHPVAITQYALVVAVAMLFALAGPAFAQDGPSPIPSGPTTADQAVAWSQATFADDSAPDVIIARDDNFPDALGAGAVQARLNAPLLLTNTTVLSPQTAAEIQRLGSSNAIILGGQEAVAPTVVVALEALGLTTERISGSNRAATAAAIVARYYPNTTSVVIARADAPPGNPTAQFADTITIAGYSSVANVPVLLTNTDLLLPETEASLSSLPLERVVIAGGNAAISSEVEAAVTTTINDGNSETTETVDRFAGAARDATAIALQGDLGYATAGDAARVILIEAFQPESWASGFAGAAQAGNDATTVLSNGDEISEATAAYLSGANVPLICGPGTTQAACDAAFAAINS